MQTWFHIWYRRVSSLVRGIWGIITVINIWFFNFNWNLFQGKKTLKLRTVALLYTRSLTYSLFRRKLGVYSKSEIQMIHHDCVRKSLRRILVIKFSRSLLLKPHSQLNRAFYELAALLWSASRLHPHQDLWFFHEALMYGKGHSFFLSRTEWYILSDEFKCLFVEIFFFTMKKHW